MERQGRDLTDTIRKKSDRRESELNLNWDNQGHRGATTRRIAQALLEEVAVVGQVEGNRLSHESDFWRIIWSIGCYTGIAISLKFAPVLDLDLPN